MVKSNDIRDVAISHFKDGKKAPEIAKLLANKVHRSTVDRWIHQYQQSGSIAVKPKSGRPRTGRTKRLINLVKKRLDSKVPRKSLRTMAKDFKTSLWTIKRVLNKDLNKKCYRKVKVQKLKEGQKSTRKSCCQWIRKNVNRDKVKKLMFTDEKIFTKNGYFNPKNDVIWASSREDANETGGIHEVEKYPVSIMVGLGATWNGITNPYFFQRGERLTGKSYCNQVLPFYKMEGNQLFDHQNWGFQQDGASCHTYQEAQEWCENNFKFFIPKDKWPPNSPELNPLDYSIWDRISNNVDYHKVKTVNDLRREIEKSVKKIEVNYVREVIGSFLRRVYSVEKHDGELIIDEHS
jgi:transposase